MRISDWSSDVCSSDLWPECDASSGTIYPSQGNRQNPRNMLVFRGFCSELSEGVSHNLTPKRAIKNAIMARLFGVSFARWPVRLESCDRSEERRVGKECVSTCRSRWSPDH